MPSFMFKKADLNAAHICRVFYCLDRQDLKCILTTDLNLLPEIRPGNKIQTNEALLSVRGVCLEFVRSNEEPLRKVNAT